MFRRLFQPILSALLLPLVCAGVAWGQEEPIPKALADWQGWVLRGQEFRRCPFLANGSTPDQSSYQCVWPERLELTVDARGGHFSQRWHVYSESWVGLPGDLAHWPESVQVDGRPAALVARNSVPSLRLAPGAHTVSGQWSWERRPETLAIPTATALLSVSVDGVRIAQPQRPDGQVALGRQESATEPRTLELQIYRLVEYNEPTRLQTRLRIRAAGDAREESLGHILPAGFEPLSLESAIPARLDRDGTLRVQIRAGEYELTLIARQAASAALRMPPAGSLVPQEVWSFEANDRLGVVTVEGAPGVDPSQAQVPEEWHRFPAFALSPGVELKLVEHGRGMSESDQDRLRLERELWLDFDHQGWTVRDQLTGTLRRQWRLDMQPPYELESARAAGDTLLVTSSQSGGGRGVELRSPQLSLTALSRLGHPFSAQPATGWSEGFESVGGTVYLPPGHRLLAVFGADESPTAWINRWGLWNLFGVLVVIVFARWVAGWQTALLGGLGLLLACQGEYLQVLLWVNLLAALALVHTAPEGALVRWARYYRVLSLVLIVCALAPFVVTELRDSIHPQLEHAGVMQDQEAVPTGGTSNAAPAPPPPPPAAEAQAPPDAVAAADTALQEEVAGLKAEQEKRSIEMKAAAGRMAQNAVQMQMSRSNWQAAQANQNYAPGTNVQAGPGVPRWSYVRHHFGWSGPVDPQQSVRFVVLGPLAVALWRIAGVSLLVLFLLQLARLKRGPLIFPPQARTAVAALLLLACGVPQLHAQSLPDSRMLDELRTRLVEPPRCTPQCAELLSAQIHVAGDRITAELRASTLARLAVALPAAADRWQIDTILVDGTSSLAVRRADDSELWLPLEPGVHTVRLEGRLFGDSVHLAFPTTPRQIMVDAPGWVAGGVSAGRLLSGALDLTRQQPAQQGTLAAAGADAQEFPPFVQVIRSFELGADWSVATRVERVSPSHAAFTVVLPLVPGESVLTEGMKVNPDGTALVGLAAGVDSREWTASLTRGAKLAVHLPALPPRSEIWRFTVSPQWHVAFQGVPAVLPESPTSTPWVFEYRPRPGEGLDLDITQPPAVAGSTLAIDRTRHEIRVGRRTTEESLVLQYRSTQGGRQMISLPSDISVTRVAVDGESVPIRPERGQLALSVLPGEHGVVIDWRSPRGEALAGRPDGIDLHVPASNVNTTLSLPADRWPLLAIGSGVGPAFLYWSELVVFLVVAWALARSRYSPLSFVEWLLLGLGLSTLSWSVLLLVGLWLFAMAWRERTTLQLEAWHFNLIQVLLAFLTIFATLTLVFSGIRYGLLAQPDMGVAGPGSYGNTFTWFLDHTTSALPRPTVISVPMWVYRVIMFAWALWIALALARWLRQSWRAWTAGGYWRDIPRREAPPQAS